jgi:hypothetical protein
VVNPAGASVPYSVGAFAFIQQLFKGRQSFGDNSSFQT